MINPIITKAVDDCITRTAEHAHSAETIVALAKLLEARISLEYLFMDKADRRELLNTLFNDYPVDELTQEVAAQRRI